MPTPTWRPKASHIATCPPRPLVPRHRFFLRAERGFLAASHLIEGPPISIVPTPEGATAFVDFVAAARRARALAELGWRNLRVVEFRLS